MKRKITIAILLVLLFICLLVIINMRRIKTKINLSYINSEKVNEGTFSPNNIHVLLAYYEGETKGPAITKSLYYFITDRVPEYRNKCKDEKKAKSYFKKNKDIIYEDIGIKDEDKFLELISLISKLPEDLVYESSNFEMGEMSKDSNGLTANLYIKYKNFEKIKIRISISNKAVTKRSPVKFFV